MNKHKLTDDEQAVLEAVKGLPPSIHAFRILRLTEIIARLTTKDCAICNRRKHRSKVARLKTEERRETMRRELDRKLQETR